MAKKSQTYQKRDIPWPKVVDFHQEVVKRAEDSFFSLGLFAGRRSELDRWTSIKDFKPDNLAGDWIIEKTGKFNREFFLALENNQHEEVFIGGPSYIGWTFFKGKMYPQWRPIFYRSVSVITEGDNVRIIPQQGKWELSPALIKLLSTLSVIPETPLERLPEKIIEEATNRYEKEFGEFDRCVLDALIKEIPEIEDSISKPIGKTKFLQEPTPWVLFAPPKGFSAYLVHLVADYQRLTNRLQRRPSEVGGLEVLEDLPKVKIKKTSPLPIVPLNKPQESALSNMLGGQPITVVSGPPGTGKSQVVVSLLLNAWAQGLKVLFTSTTNKAVDVVRERLERFENEVPVAVRAGNRDVNKVDEVIRRIQNLVNLANENDSVIEFDKAGVKRKRRILKKKKDEFLSLLDSQVPQRIDQGWRSAQGAYTKYRAGQENLKKKEEELNQEISEIGYGVISSRKVMNILKEFNIWFERIVDYKKLIKNDKRQNKEYQDKSTKCSRARNTALGKCNLELDKDEDPNWLLDSQGDELLESWFEDFRTIIKDPLEEALEPYHWEKAYEEWSSENDAQQWSTDAELLTKDIQSFIGLFHPKIEQVETAKKELDKSTQNLNQFDIDNGYVLERIKGDENSFSEALTGWLSIFMSHASREAKWYDTIPFLPLWWEKLKQRRLESKMREIFGLEVWEHIGTLDIDGRKTLAKIIDVTRNWLSARNNWLDLSNLREDIETELSAIRERSAKLRMDNFPNNWSIDDWRSFSEKLSGKVSVANSASEAWHKKVESEKIMVKLDSEAKKFTQIASGLPLKTAWLEGSGSIVSEIIANLQNEPKSETVVKAREMTFSNLIPTFVRNWKEAKTQQIERIQYLDQAKALPTYEDRIEQWWDERPDLDNSISETSVVWGWSAPTDFPSKGNYIFDHYTSLKNWGKKWKKFDLEERGDLESQIHTEGEWALDKLNDAIEAVTDSKVRKALKELSKDTYDLEKSSYKWPIDALSKQFTQFSPSRLKARLEAVESDLESLSFEEAKSKWLERAQNDTVTLRAIDDLGRLYKQRNQLFDKDYKIFKEALDIIPIWITTAQATQHIPMEPGLFDLVVVDEATQCTLTNLLPLLYRGKKIAVIGDEDQLKAIPNISSLEEGEIAKKYDVKEWMSLLGHWENNVYKTAVKSLPNRRTDVVMLKDHYRSHPLIIGFSNQYIYGHRLKLLRDPETIKEVPWGAGVHAKHIKGKCERGAGGKSYQNKPEAGEVIALVKALMKENHSSLSIGIVTPFRAQLDLIKERLDEEGLLENITVGVAHTFQGDERDVVIFSLTASRGIKPTGIRFMEEPPNLVNVAVTRAREALFVVGDLDFCRNQKGIIGELIKYCDGIQKIRDAEYTSNEEMALYEWMVLDNIQPEVHQIIGDLEVDFLVKNAGIKLVVEVDGSQHDDQKAEDAARDAFLQARGYDVLRVPTREIQETPAIVMEKIRKALELEDPDYGAEE